MKIGIITFHAAHNYGAMLQNYALQQHLISRGYEVETINLRIKAQRDFYHFPLRPVKGQLQGYLLSLSSPIWMWHALRKWFRFESFLKKNIRLSNKVFKTWEDIVKSLPGLNYDCIITGGDQIWNMNLRDYSDAYYLPSPLVGIKKVSYSPSFGRWFLSRITGGQESFIKKWVSDYNYISVREDSMQTYLHKLTGRDISITCDPTILLDASSYDKFISNKPIIKGGYIYYYSPFLNPSYERLAKMIGDHYGLKVVTSLPHFHRNGGLITAPEAGPADFLNLIKNASLVIGRSFHLVVFALLFHKSFIALDGETDERLKNILNLLNIPERGLVNENNFKTISLPAIDYDLVDMVLDRERKMSIQFLQEALNF